MGFSNGYSSRTDRGSKRYSNDMVAHTWNAQSSDSGQSGNGNFYFRGRTLYSYGSHFIVGYIMPDGLALLNADSYSVTTSGHQSDASAATRNRRTCHVAGLTNLAGDWKAVDRLAAWIARGKPAGERANVRLAVKLALVEHATALTAEINAPGASRWTRGESQGELGAYLADLAGLPSASWPKAKRDAEKLARQAAAADDKARRANAERLALTLADMPNRQWRNWIAESATDYTASRVENIRRDLKRSRSLMLKAKSGKLAAAGRLAIVRERIKHTTAVIATFEENRNRREAARSLRHAVAIVRQWRDASADGKALATWHTFRDLAACAERLAKSGRLAGLKASAAELQRLAFLACDLIRAENARLAAVERERAKLAQAERVALWLAGERVGRVDFDADSGGAALRVIGDTLETSHGATVPLAHAVKAFRFVKLCKERGESWHRNGKTVRVGHFQVDSISANGDFRAGCHSFTWPEIERVAKLAGVFDCDASADAVEPTAVAA